MTRLFAPRPRTPLGDRGLPPASAAKAARGVDAAAARAGANHFDVYPETGHKPKWFVRAGPERPPGAAGLPPSVVR